MKLETRVHLEPFVRDIGCDVIGKVDPVTNLRPIKFYIPENEGRVEKLYRFERQRVQQWNMRFWKHHNEMFKKVSTTLL